MLTKDLLRVSRVGGGFHPQFAGEDDRTLAATVIGTFQGHVGHSRGTLSDAVEEIERDADDFKLVRGFAKLLEREAAFETNAPVDPGRARQTAFSAAEAVGVVTESERETALANAAERLGATPDAVDESLFADLDERQELAEFETPWSPEGLVAQYNLSLAQTALFDATEVRIRSSDPRAVVSAVKRLRLMYEIRKENGGREFVVTGPDALFRRTRRYGTRFARLLRTVARAQEWELTATIDDRGTERTLSLSDSDPIDVPDADPVAEVSYDSGVESDFAARFSSLDLDWTLTREPEPLMTGTRVMIPDFAFDYRHADFRVYFEIMGFWTPEYVEKKLSQLADLEDVELLVAVDESLGVGEEIEATDRRAIRYSDTVRIKDVRDALRRYERRLVAESAESLPEELRPDEDAIELEALAARHGVSERAIETASFPDHRRIGRTLIRPDVLDAIDAEIREGMSLETARETLSEYDVDDASAVLSELGYRVEWDGLSGGTLRSATDASGTDA